MNLPNFVERVNLLVENFATHFRKPKDGRVTDEFTDRTVRHYQSKEIINALSKDGKEARYGYRHILQALLVRRMLAAGIYTDKITDILADKDNAVFRKLLIHGVEMSVGLEPAISLIRNRLRLSRVAPLLRLPIVPGLEIHIARGFQSPNNPDDFKDLRQQRRRSLLRVINRRKKNR